MANNIKILVSFILVLCSQSVALRQSELNDVEDKVDNAFGQEQLIDMQASIEAGAAQNEHA